MARKDFHSSEYVTRNGSSHPIVKLNVVSNSLSLPVEAYVDTGNTRAALVMTRLKVKELKLTLGENINSSPEPCYLADGAVIGADIYPCELELSGERRKRNLFVIDPNLQVKIEEKKPRRQPEPLLGRPFLDDFDVTFSGIDKKLTFRKEVPD